jgi:hypothetical protein
MKLPRPTRWAGRGIRRSSPGRARIRRQKIQMQIIPGNVGTGATKPARACVDFTSCKSILFAAKISNLSKMVFASPYMVRRSPHKLHR